MPLHGRTTNLRVGQSNVRRGQQSSHLEDTHLPGWRIGSAACGECAPRLHGEECEAAAG